MDKGFRRNSILMMLHSAAPDTLSEPALLHGIRSNGYPKLDEDALQRELAYLRDKQFAASSTAALNKAQLRWRITADGTDHLEANGFV